MSAQLERLAARLYPEPGEAGRFVAAVRAGGSGRRVAAWPGAAPPVGGEVPGWLPGWVGAAEGAGEAGYVLDLSSVWAMAVVTAVAGPVRRLLDLCAAPGGKSVVAARWLRPGLHVANELVPKRLGILRHNLARCGVAAFTQRQRAEWWAEHCVGGFDVVLVDAPCSGQSLPARGVRNPGCFHPAVVAGNVRRQRGVLARAAAAVAPGGHLVYATCTYSLEENERVVRWFLKGREDWSAVAVPALGAWRSPHVTEPCHRLGPQHGLGAGGFVALLRRGGEPGQLPGLPAEVCAWPVAPGAAAPGTRTG